MNNEGNDSIDETLDKADLDGLLSASRDEDGKEYTKEEITTFLKKATLRYRGFVTVYIMGILSLIGCAYLIVGTPGSIAVISSYMMYFCYLNMQYGAEIRGNLRQVLNMFGNEDKLPIKKKDDGHGHYL